MPTNGLGVPWSLEFGESNSVNVLAVRKECRHHKARLDRSRSHNAESNKRRSDHRIPEPKTPARKPDRQHGTALFQYDYQDDQDNDQADDGHQAPIISRLAPEPVQPSPGAVQTVLMAFYVAVHSV